jgi:teichuronic acid biosynthesis glycosyltransferase TuaH
VDIIIFALARTDHRYSSTAFSLAKEFSKDHRVFFIENPFTIKDYFSLRNTSHITSRKAALLFGKDNIRNVAGLPPGFHQVITQAIIPFQWVSPGILYDFISYINDKIVYRAIKKAIKSYGLKDFVYINSFNPFFGKYFPATFRPHLFIYQSVDDISHSDHINRHGLRMENYLIRKADLTITTSIELRRLKLAISERVFCIPNAADIAIFASVFDKQFPLPAEYGSINKKIVIYIGNIEGRIDFALCRHLAAERPEIAFVYVGPVNTVEHKKFGLTDLPNVYFPGIKTINELPAYLQHAHCAMIPFVYSKLTKSIYPLKVNEYLAAGMPVVSTRFSEDIESFESTIYLAKSHADFLQCIDKAIDDNSLEQKQRRLQTARSNSWQNRASEFYDVIKKHWNSDGRK